MFEVDHVWTSTGSSGGLTPLHVAWSPTQSVMYVGHSTLASTQSVSVQSAPASSGPWAIEVSQAIPTAVSAQYAIRFTGPYKYVRPYIHSASTGTYTFRLIGHS